MGAPRRGCVRHPLRATVLHLMDFGNNPARPRSIFGPPGRASSRRPSHDPSHLVPASRAIVPSKGCRRPIDTQDRGRYTQPQEKHRYP